MYTYLGRGLQRLMGRTQLLSEPSWATQPLQQQGSQVAGNSTSDVTCVLALLCRCMHAAKAADMYFPTAAAAAAGDGVQDCCCMLLPLPGAWRSMRACVPAKQNIASIQAR